MVIAGKTKYRKAIRITPMWLHELDELLNRYFTKVDYKAELINGSSVSFESLEELTSYENFGKQKIKSITIYGKFDYDSTALTMNIDAGWSPFASYGTTCEVEYKVSNSDAENNFCSNLTKLMAKAKMSYWLIGKFHLAQIFLLIAIWSVITFAISFVNGTINTNTTETISGIWPAMVTLITIAMIFIYYLIPKLWRWLFPPVVCYWGEEIKRYDKWATIRSNIFWVIIVGIALAIFIPFALKWFPILNAG